MANLTLEEKKKKVRDLRPIDDVFFEVLADDTAFCQEILRVILEDGQLSVEDVIVQSSRRNLYGRSVRLDALCTLGNGKKVNIEVQRFHNDDHVKRVRFNASVITARESQTASAFEDIPELYVVYLSEFDIFKKGFTKKMVENPKFPVFTRRMWALKEEEGGVAAVCDVMKKYEQIAHSEGLAEGRAEGQRSMIRRMLSRGKTPEEIADFCGCEIDEIQAVEEAMCTTV